MGAVVRTSAYAISSMEVRTPWRVPVPSTLQGATFPGTSHSSLTGDSFGSVLVSSAVVRRVAQRLVLLLLAISVWLAEALNEI